MQNQNDVTELENSLELKKALRKLNSEQFLTHLSTCESECWSLLRDCNKDTDEILTQLLLKGRYELNSDSELNSSRYLTAVNAFIWFRKLIGFDPEGTTQFYLYRQRAKVNLVIASIKYCFARDRILSVIYSIKGGRSGLPFEFTRGDNNSQPEKLTNEKLTTKELLIIYTFFHALLKALKDVSLAIEELKIAKKNLDILELSRKYYNATEKDIQQDEKKKKMFEALLAQAEKIAFNENLVLDPDIINHKAFHNFHNKITYMIKYAYYVDWGLAIANSYELIKTNIKDFYNSVTTIAKDGWNFVTSIFAKKAQVDTNPSGSKNASADELDSSQTTSLIRASTASSSKVEEVVTENKASVSKAVSFNKVV